MPEPRRGDRSIRRRHPLLSGLAAAAIAAAAPGGAARAAARPGPVAVVTTAGFTFVPGDEREPFATTLEVPAGARLLFANADGLAPHSVTAEATDPGGRPLFDSGEPADAGSAVWVRGVERLAPGAYRFSCRAHTAMLGSLRVHPPGAPAGLGGPRGEIEEEA